MPVRWPKGSRTEPKREQTVILLFSKSVAQELFFSKGAEAAVVLSASGGFVPLTWENL